MDASYELGVVRGAGGPREEVVDDESVEGVEDGEDEVVVEEGDFEGELVVVGRF